METCFKLRRSPRFLFAALLMGFSLIPMAAHAIEENGYAERYGKEVVPFVERNSVRDSFAGKDGIRIETLSVTPPTGQRLGDIVLVQGKSESFYYYYETIYDFVQAGYAVHTYDHRSQGISGRIASDRGIVHVLDFFDYVDDLATFTRKLFGPGRSTDGKRFVLSHSMGGAVTALALGRDPTLFDKAVFVAPMARPNLKGVPQWLARGISNVAVYLNHGQSFVFGGRPPDLHDLQTGEYDLTHSEARTGMINQVTREHPEASTASASWTWLREALRASRIISAHAPEFKTPSLLFEAGKDTWVDTAAQESAGNAAPDCKVIKLSQSNHTILFERDEIRNQAIQQILSFFR